ncbi:MAG: enoyl-CoA hydratase/isomerase family protein [Deltaproteobacteria bacterium]|uniref:Enoyl-CoA hydratase/isomerase family protein n=1 Tax=Candidatus Zymogenus saltonus TaxID=2844893 RepID=A0A9D8PP63_9DELT|nr:enoyl-CoA hydratase/isomerase family protein [Candidatus Zymogenus saltonus]
MSYSLLKYEIDRDVAVVTMNSPPANWMSRELLFELEDAVNRLKNEVDIRAVVIASSCEGYFSAGADISMLKDAMLKDIGEETLDMIPRAQAIFNSLEDVPLPTVAAISGHALGGGLELVLACDFRFMAKGSGRIGLPEARLGLIPSFGGTQRLPSIVGRAKALEMMINGLQLKSNEAKEIGLLTDVFEGAELMEKSMSYARRLAKQATGAIARIKKCVNTGLREGFDRGIIEEARAFREIVKTADAKEGIEDFLSGRRPRFTGS